jgi:hypothetical protein
MEPGGRACVAVAALQARLAREQQQAALEKKASDMVHRELHRRAEALGVRLSPFLRRRESDP